ncbi:putative phosphohydrolase [Lactococcus cremoris]|nr:putative phosphohydrolase [Lactococcus cremoris]
MKLIKTFLTLFLIALLASVGCLYYAFKVEPYRLTLNEHQVQSVASEEKLKLVQISDLHIKKDYTAKHLEKVVQKVNEQSPDFIVFTGDLYDNYSNYQDNEQVASKLAHLRARYGKIAIWGNRDYGGGASRIYENMMQQAGFSLLRNENLVVGTSQGRSILFTGLDDALLGNPVLPPTVEEMNGTAYDILLTHEPDEVIQYQGKGYELILSGHSHGGQVNIPFFPQVQKKAAAVMGHANRYTGGLYTLDTGEKLYVNTGIGTTHLSARFGILPEIAVFYI